VAAADEKVLQLFVSSPGDVQGERERVDLVVELLNAEFKGRVHIKVIRWETSFYSSHDTFQRQIPEAAECDAVIAIFGARLGSQLPPTFPPMPTGEPYPSGTAYEVLTAIESRRKGSGIPDIYVFRRPSAPSVALDAGDRAEIETQWSRLKLFFEHWFLTRSGEFLAAFQDFSTTDEFAAKVEACLRQWLARRGFGAHEAVWDRVLLGSPFPGLSAFDESRRAVFFGRDLVVAQAIERLRRAGEPDPENKRAPFLLVIGASGSGKSSLLRAGLMPRLVQPGSVPSVDHWRRALMTPSFDPFLSLAESLFAEEALGAFLRAGTFRTKEILARQLAADPDIAIAPLRDALDEAARARQRAARFAQPRLARLALAIDQAERLLLETEPGLAARFVVLIAALAQHGLAYVVMALRSDAYARFQSIEALVSLREAGATIDLLASSAGELEEMVTRPVAACDPPLAFEQKNGRSLAAALVADARGGDALPLLQMTLARLYLAEAARGDGLLRFADYQGMDAAVTQTANEALETLDAAARAELPALVTAFVRDVADDPVTGAPAPVIASLDRPGFEAQNPARRALIDAFVAKRLLTTEGDAASQRVRPVHEALLRIWPQAVAIVEEAGNLIRVRHALEPIVREWSDSAPGDKARHLDISPALLSGAQRLVERFGADAPAPMREFIAQSSAVAEARAAREREEQERRLADAQAIAAANRRAARRTGVGLVAALVLAVLAGWQWRSAESQRARAENTLNLATATADDLVFDIGQKSTCSLGMPKPVLKGILDRARALQEQLLNAGESTLKLKANHGAALAEIARAQLALGDMKGALDLALKAREIFASVSAEAPTDSRYVVNLAFSNLKIGDILKEQADLDGALAAYQRGQATVDAALARGEHDPRVLRMQASAIEGVGTVAMAKGDYAGALKSFRQSVAVYEPLADADPKDVKLHNSLAIADREVGDALLKLGNIEGAATTFDAAARLSEPLARTNPDDTCLVRDYSLSEERLGETLTAKREYVGALEAFEAGESTAVAMALKDPANLEWQYDIAIGHTEIGDAKYASGDIAGAVEAYRSAMEIDKALVAHEDANALWRTHYWQDLSNLGNALAKHGELGAAIDTHRDALKFAQSIVDRNGADKTWRQNVVASDNNLGDALLAHQDIDSAAKVYGDGLALARKLAESDANSLDITSDLFASLSKVAGALTLKGDEQGALKAYRESELVLRKLILAEVNVRPRRGQLALVLVAEGHLLKKQGADDEAVAAFRESAALSKALAAEEPANKVWPRAESTAQEGVGDALRHKGDAQGMIDSYRESLTIDSRLLKDDPSDKDLRNSNALKRELIGIALNERKDLAGAVEAFKAAAELRRGLANDAPADPQQRRSEMADDNSLGSALAGRRDFVDALAAYRDGLKAARALDAREGAPYDLAVSLNFVGWMLMQQNDAAGAAQSFAEALPIARALAKDAPSNVSFQRGAWLVGVNLGDARLKQNDRVGALDVYSIARDAAAALVGLEGTNASYAGLLKASVDKIGYAANAMLLAREYEASLAALDKATPMTPDQNWFDLVRAACLMMLDRPDEARPLYLKHRGEISYGGKPWETVATQGFAQLRGLGMTRPLMDEIEKTFAAAP
jgi:tetratricopeptide (TPR) repeat protein